MNGSAGHLADTGQMAGRGILQELVEAGRAYVAAFSAYDLDPGNTRKAQTHAEVEKRFLKALRSAEEVGLV